MQTLTSETLAEGFVYGEGPRWHDGRLWFSDVQDRAVKTVDERGTIEVAVEIDHPSGLGWLPNGDLLISTLGAALISRVNASGVEVIHDFSDRGWTTNDMVVGPTGNVYVDLYHEHANPPPGSVLLIRPDGRVETVATDLLTPNGLVITPDGSTLIVSETGTGKVLAFAINPDGTLRDRRVFADLGRDRHPDGICLDAAGGVWVGTAMAAEFLRVLDGGEITHRIATPGRWAVATALGGPDRRTLFLVIDETTPEGLMRGESRGWIDTVRVDVPGVGWP